ncbi:MAG: flagellar motor switch protein FliM [Desulfobacterales bacterium]|nr:flagellar motor switch protein FliM [Desulfobacterales bacterium]MCP4161724.1 flagellar motor switch protein FliM [Deltaproteobacteria bacterium]
MSDILSQEEVDSLLSGLSQGQVETETAVPQEPGVATGGSAPKVSYGGYDFTNQDRVIRGRMPTFEVINERFAREIRTSLSKMLHTTVDISAESLDTIKFAEFGRSLPVPTSLHVFRMEPLRGHALLVLESQLVFNLIDQFFGGKGSSKARIEGREFTAIEDVMINKVVEECLKDLSTSWLPVEPVKTILVRSEVNPQFASIVMPDDLVIVTRYEIELEQSVGTLIVCLPYAMIEPLRGKLAAGFQAEVEDIDYTWQKRLKGEILSSEIELKIQLGTVRIDGERLIQLKLGDVIQLDQDADEPLIGYIEGASKLQGFAGIQRGFRAFRLEKKLHLKRD